MTILQMHSFVLHRLYVLPWLLFLSSFHLWISDIGYWILVMFLSYSLLFHLSISFLHFYVESRLLSLKKRITSPIYNKNPLQIFCSGQKKRQAMLFSLSFSYFIFSYMLLYFSTIAGISPLCCVRFSRINFSSILASRAFSAAIYCVCSIFIFWPYSGRLTKNNRT